MKSFITNNHLTVLVTKALIRKAMSIGVAFFLSTLPIAAADTEMTHRPALKNPMGLPLR